MSEDGERIGKPGVPILGPWPIDGVRGSDFFRGVGAAGEADGVIVDSSVPFVVRAPMTDDVEHRPNIRQFTCC